MKALIPMLILAIACTIAPAQETQKTTPTNQQTNPQPGDKTTATGSASMTPEMKTTTFKGLLVDMSCASRTSASAGTTAGQTTQPSDTTKTPASDESNTANRSAGDPNNCPVTANSSTLGMKLDDGRTVRFDLVGNQRAQDELKNNKRWTKAITDNKPIHAKVSGVLNGDKLIVSSIH